MQLTSEEQAWLDAYRKVLAEQLGTRGGAAAEKAQLRHAHHRR